MLEILDFGYPQSTDPDVLKLLITTNDGSSLVKVRATAKKNYVDCRIQCIMDFIYFFETGVFYFFSFSRYRYPRELHYDAPS
jgi:hypothetical protein